MAILFGIGVALHNLEEALYLVSRARSHLTLWFEPNPKIYAVLTSLVSVVIWVPIVGVCVSPESRHFQSVLSGFALAMAINAVLPHFVISLVKRSYSPGTGTGMLFNLPLGVLLIRGQLSAHATSHAEVWREAVLYALLLAVGGFGSLYGAHAIFAARKAGASRPFGAAPQVTPFGTDSFSARSGWNLLEETRVRRHNLAMPTPRQKARKHRGAKVPGRIPDPRANPQHIPPTIAKEDPKWLQFVEHPLFLAVLAIVGAVVGVVFYTAVLLVPVVCVLLALHRSKILRGQGKSFEVSTYIVVFLLSAPLLLGVGLLLKEPVREYIRIARGGQPRVKPPSVNTPPAAASAAAHSVPLPGGIFASPGLGAMATSRTTTVPARSAAEDRPPPNSAEAALTRQMREKLTADAGDPQKIAADVQWMRDQFEQGWAQEPPALARKHREETEQTARMLLAAASNRAAVLQMVPQITIDK